MWPPGREWELRVRELEEEDEDEDEPGLWTRVRSLLLNLSLQLYHRLSKVREQLLGAVASLGVAADTVRRASSLPPSATGGRSRCAKYPQIFRGLSVLTDILVTISGDNIS